ncbi:STAS domain-containing protein [Fundidesulfovibrio butyratiphilus]
MAKADKISPWKGVVSDETGVIKLSGEIDFTNSQMVRDWMTETFAQSQGEVRLDMSDVEYIDSSGLAVLIEVRKALKANGRSIKVTSASLQVHKLFSLTQIGDLFGI